MLILFGLFFIASISFILIFLYQLPSDLKKQSLRPLFLLLFAIGLWVATLPAFLSPENTISILTPAYNVITPSGTTQFPSYTVNSLAVLSVRSYNAFFYIWVAILGFMLFLLLVWWLLLLKERTSQLLKGGRDMMEEIERKGGII